MTTCIYCKRPNTEPSAEHVIADSLGGCITLSANDVCKACNNQFDQQIDRFVQGGLAPILAQLLIPGKRGQVTRWRPSELVDGETRQLTVTATEVRAAEPRKLITQDGNSYEFRATSLDELEKARTEIAAKHPGQQVILEDVEERPLNLPEDRTDFLDFTAEAWGRWAAKTVLNAICYVHGREVALRSEFDDLREYALGLSSRPLSLSVGGIGDGIADVDDLRAEHRIHVATDQNRIGVRVELFGYCGCQFSCRGAFDAVEREIKIDALAKRLID